MQLNLSNISYRYAASPREVLVGVSVTFPQGWTGIVGDNGCGKTTLARVAAGELAPTAGTVLPKLASAYCEQNSARVPAMLEDFACAWDHDAILLRDQLGIGDDWPWRFGQLSCGQQKRLQVAVALWRHPDVLVMDEPTNHLDAPSREAVARALEGFGGVGILISHDRDLLDRLVSRCVCFEGARVVERPGTYSLAASQRELEEGSARAAKREARREQARLERERQRRVEVASHAIATGMDARATHQARMLDARIAAAGERAAAAQVAKRYDGDVPSYGVRSRRGVLVRVTAQVVPFGQADGETDGQTPRCGVAVPNLALSSADHVAIVGPNGSGKSTVVRALVAGVPADVPMVYVPQEFSDAEAAAVLGGLRDLASADRGRVLSVVAQLNSSPEALLGGSASPGELRKLALAEGVLAQPQLLVMDEPTNHLDLHSVEALERLLARFPGAVVLVSHDARLVEAVAGTLWRVEPDSSGDGSRLVAG